MINEFFKFITNELAFGWYLYAILIVPSFLIWWVFLRERLKIYRIQFNQKATRKHILHDIWFSFLSLVTSNVIYFLLDYLEKHDLTLIYFDIDEYGWPWLFLSLFVIIVIHDTYFYWTHRAMHGKWFYRHFHKIHHASTDPSPFTAYAFHPVEWLVNLGVVFLLIFIIPINIYVMILWLLLQQFFNMIGHLGYEIYPSWWIKTPFLKWKTTSTHHNMHHEYFEGNYGLYFTFWDRYCGTEFKNYELQFIALHNRKNEPWEGKQPSTILKVEVAQVEFQNKGKTYRFSVQEGETLLDAAIRSKVPVLYHCQKGICKTCKVSCEAGQTNMPPTKTLTKEELEAGYILCCQAKPLNNQIRISK